MWDTVQVHKFMELIHNCPNIKKPTALCTIGPSRYAHSLLMSDNRGLPLKIYFVIKHLLGEPAARNDWRHHMGLTVSFFMFSIWIGLGHSIFHSMSVRVHLLEIFGTPRLPAGCKACQVEAMSDSWSARFARLISTR